MVADHVMLAVLLMKGALHRTSRRVTPITATSLFRLLTLQLALGCVCLHARCAAETVSGTPWRGFNGFRGFSPANPGSAWPVHFKGQCVIGCQSDARCHGVLYHDVSKTCQHVTSALDIVKDDAGLTGFRYYTDKWRCPKVTPSGLVLSTVCFVVDTNAQVDWTDARDACGNAGGRLAVLDSHEKLEAVFAEMRSNQTFYKDNDYHLGLLRPVGKWNTAWPSTGQDFAWLNGAPLDMTVTGPYWNQVMNEPNNFQLGDNVVYIGTELSGFVLNDIPDRWLKGYVCEYFLI